MSWLAHRIQRPGEKINHALVLGGNPGIGKDTVLHPVKAGVGEANWSEVNPLQIVGSSFNPWVQCVVARISEVHDLKQDRMKFYEVSKVYIAAPPEALHVNQKHTREYYVPNVMGVIYTTNNLTNGLYLPSDDRRHYVAWSDAAANDFPDHYWKTLWGWLEAGGKWDVVAYLASLDITAFNPKAPPPKTSAFFAIAQSNEDPELSELAALIEQLGAPDAIVLDDIARAASASKQTELEREARERSMRRSMVKKLERLSYMAVRNPDAKDRQWAIQGRRVAVYARQAAALSHQLLAVRKLISERNRPDL